MIHKTLCALFLATAALMTTGCQQLAILMTPDLKPKVPRQFELPKEKQTTLLIDNLLLENVDARIRMQMAEKIYQLLDEHTSITQQHTIDYEKMEQLDKRKPGGKLWSIQHLGQELKAQTVIYVNIIQFNLQSDPESPLIRPTARARVKVLDAETGKRLWPVDYAGKTVSVTERRQTDTLDEKNREQWRRKLADMLATKIAQLFYTHRQKE